MPTLYNTLIVGTGPSRGHILASFHITTTTISVYFHQ
jgi:hypothetical protein